MPLQRFRPISGRCKLCDGNLEISVSANEPIPIECPRCGQEIDRCPNLTAAPAKILKKTSISDAKAAGFKVLKKIGKGEYESQ